MRIACIGTGWYPQEPGGLEKYVYGMTRALLNAGDTVDLFVTGEPHLSEARARAYSIGTPGQSLLKRMRDARATFARSFVEPYDAVNLHFAMNALPLIPFIKHAAPRIVHFHGPWAIESRAEGDGKVSVAIKERLEQFVYRRADRFIVLSSAFKELLMTYGVAAEQITVIPMGIDCSFFRDVFDKSAVRRGLGWPADVPIFFTARRLVNRVGLHELLVAARNARASNRCFMVKIAGKGPLHAELAKSIQEFGLNDCVELLGFVSEEQLVRAYQAATVTILPTQSLEGFGTIISESLACGTPVVVTPVGGMPEAVAPLSRDMIMRSSSPDDIADAIERIVDGALTLPDTATCRAYALEHYDWNRIILKVKSVFSNNPSGSA